MNAEATLEATILSVAAQSYRPVEHIIIDGGSTDRTVEIIRRHEHRLRHWVSELDGGIYDAMNKGISRSTGDWLYFLGADDVLLDCLHRIVPALTDARTIYYGDVYMPAAHKLYDGPFNGYKRIFQNICHQAIFYPRALFERYRYNPKYRLLADHALNMQCYGDRSFQWSYLPILVALYNDAGGKSFNAFDPDFERDRPELVRAAFPWYLHLIFTLRMSVYRLKRQAMKTREARPS